MLNVLSKIGYVVFGAFLLFWMNDVRLNTKFRSAQGVTNTTIAGLVSQLATVQGLVIQNVDGKLVINRRPRPRPAGPPVPPNMTEE